jgi:hypothetical protein
MAYSLLDEQWGLIRAMLPENLDELARAHGAMRRRRGEVKDAETLLRLILLHVGGGLSLEQTVLRAREHGLAQLSAVALFKRLRVCEHWLGALTAGLLRQMPGPKLASLGGRYQVRALDATFIQEPGSTGTDWRLHYSLKLPELVCDFFEITDAHGAESLRRLPVRKGDVVLADRGYSKRSGAAALLKTGAEVVLRLLPSGFPLLKPGGQRLDLAQLLPSALAREGEVLEKKVCFEYEGERFKLRLCAVRKSQAACAAARRRARYERARKGGNVREETPELAAFVCVLTSLPADIVSAREVLDLYRCRWQIELAFKRLKSLLDAGHLPKKDPPGCRAWMQAKVLIALLTERLILESELFSPWGYHLRGRKPVELLSRSA